MRIRQLAWDESELARDLHVLPGHVTRSLVPSLIVWFADLSVQPVQTFLAATPMATLTFRPLFKKGTVTGDKFEGLGFKVDTKTGVVEVTASPGKNNFIILIELTTPDGGSPSVIKTFRETIRIQAHTSVTKVWLTPSRLTVRQGTPSNATTRFTVRAQFNDNSVGDLTLNHGVTWQAASAGRVSAEGFLHLIVGDAPGDFDITAKLSPAFGGLSTAPAKFRVAPSWTAVAPKAASVVGGGSPFISKPEKVPNVIFLGDGYPPAVKDVFERSVDLIIDRLRTSRLTRPYDLLTTSINFWRVLMPADASGLSCREEVSTRVQSGQIVARPLPPALAPPKTGPWAIEHLLYAVGLPVAADGGPTAPTASSLRTAWASLVSTEFTAALGSTDVVPDTVIEQWKALATRTFIDEQDGFPCVAMGAPPAATITAGGLLTMHPDRGGEGALGPFFDVLAAEDGTTLPGGLPIGRLWQRPANAAFRFDNTRLRVLMSPYPGGRPLNSGGNIAVGTNPQFESFPVTAIAGRNSHALIPLVPPGLSNEIAQVIAHELAHSFGLGDEYQEFDGSDPQFDDKDLDRFANLQYETAVRTGRTGPLRSELIKWNWHRIKKATLVEGPITPVPGGFRVPVAPGHGFLFAAGDPVLLRVRKDREPLGKAPTVALGPTHVGEVVAPLSAIAVVIKPAPGSTLTTADLSPFLPGSLIYVPVEAPASVRSAAYPYAELVAKNIRDYIDTKNLPLTRLPCALDKSDVVRPIIPGVALRAGFCGLCTPFIVGLYSGGHRYSCGVFHPTGCCVMAPGEGAEFKGFCPVCCYVLVDFINPVLHGQIDEDYDAIYPQP